MRAGNRIILALCILMMNLSPYSVYAATTVPTNAAAYDAACALRMDIRQLWMDHTAWTRSFIVSNLANLEDKPVVLERLLRNQDDIGNSIKPYYGEEAGNKLAVLLREHIEFGGKVVEALKTGNTADLQQYNTEWYKNADEIADFLSSINPKLPKKELHDMMHEHLQFVTELVTARLNKDWAGEISNHDHEEEHTIRFADTLTDAIIAQFPEKFQ